MKKKSASSPCFLFVCFFNYFSLIAIELNFHQRRNYLSEITKSQLCGKQMCLPSVPPEQSYGYFLYFCHKFASPYRTPLLGHKFFSHYHRNKSKSILKQTTSQISFYLFYLRHKSTNLKKNVPEDFSQDEAHFHPDHWQPDTFINSFCATEYSDNTGPLSDLDFSDTHAFFGSSQ